MNTPAHTRFKTSFYMALVYFVALLGPFKVNSEELTLVVDDYPPYIDQSQTNQGFWSEMVITAFSRVDIEATLEYKPWGRVERELNQANKVSFGYVKDSKRLQRWLFSHAISHGTSGFLVKKDREFSWKEYKDLLPYRIGRTIGYSFGNEFQQWQDKLNIDDVPEDLQNIRKLLANRIDIYATDLASSAMLIRQYFNQEQRDSLTFVSTPALTIWSAHLVCAKSFDRCPYYIKKFNDGLAILDREGIKQEIIDKIHSLN